MAKEKRPPSSHAVCIFDAFYASANNRVEANGFAKPRSVPFRAYVLNSSNIPLPADGVPVQFFAGNSHRWSVLIPTGTLEPGTYVVEVSNVSNDHQEHVADCFRIVVS